jgi:Flp pilus assembly protein TadG
MKMRKRQAERGIAVIATTIMLVMLIPVVGLSIDVTLLYVDKARLQGAVDGAALAGAESLARGANDAAQQTSARQAAAMYVFLNYPTNFFFTNSVTVNQATDVTINESVANQRTVSVIGHANVPTLFMNWLHFTSTNVTASATVTRRDVNIMFVMDRSGSLQNSGSCTPAKAAGVTFLSHFALGTDNVGLITFATSSRVDSALSTAFSGMSTIINNITCSGATSSAQALWQGYQSLATLAQPSALNVIVFFTDGQPTGVTALLPLTAGSACNSNGPFTGVFTVGFQTSSPFSPVGTGGVFDYIALAQPITSDDNIISGSEGNTTNCAFANNWSNNWGNAYQDIAGIPTTDIWGNNLNTGYQAVNLSGGLVTVPSNSTGALNVIAAATNAADNAALRIRAAAAPLNGATALSNIVILAIGLGNSTYPANDDLLERITNDPRASSYDSTKPAGLYVSAPTAADLGAAFAAVASEILRIAK